MTRWVIPSESVISAYKIVGERAHEVFQSPLFRKEQSCPPPPPIGLRQDPKRSQATLLPRRTAE